MEREDPFDPLAEGHLAHRERRARAAAVNPDHDAFENLNAFLIALAHLDVHADRVPRLHRGPFGQLRLFHQLNRAHTRLLCRAAPRARAESPALLHPTPRRPAARAAAPAYGS